MRSLATRERRIVAIGLLVVAFALAYLLVVGPILAGFADRKAAREMLLMSYARNARAIAGIPALRRLASAQQRDATRYRIVAPSSPLAVEALKELLNARVAGAGGEVMAMQEVASQPGSVRAWIDCRVGIDQLVPILAGLQNSTPYLVVEGLTVSADRAFQTGHMDAMNVRIEVSGAYSPSAPR